MRRGWEQVRVGSEEGHVPCNDQEWDKQQDDQTRGRNVVVWGASWQTHGKGKVKAM